MRWLPLTFNSIFSPLSINFYSHTNNKNYEELILHLQWLALTPINILHPFKLTQTIANGCFHVLYWRITHRTYKNVLLQNVIRCVCLNGYYAIVTLFLVPFSRIESMPFVMLMLLHSVELCLNGHFIPITFLTALCASTLFLNPFIVHSNAFSFASSTMPSYSLRAVRPGIIALFCIQNCSI